jgi:peptidoglycan/LPS O-acetylase OafA/YrhL
VNGPTTQRLHGLDVLRASAIVMVLVAHYPKAFAGLIDRMLNFGWSGVDLFFVLSGYLIGSQVIQALARGEAVGLRDFYRRRFLRTLPAYYVVLAVYFLVRVGSEPAPNWKFLVLTQNFSPMNTFAPSWALCVEEQFYLLFPIVAGLLWKRKGIGIGLVFFVPLAARTVSWLATRPDLLAEPQALGTYMRFIYDPTYCRLDGIMLGVGIAALKYRSPQVWRRWMARPGQLMSASAVVLVAAVAALWTHYSFWCSTIGFTLLDLSFALLTMAALSESGWLSRIRIPGVQTIAVLSYSIYLTHSLALDLNQGLLARFGISMNSVIGVCVASATILAFAALLHWSVERPMMAWRDRLLREEKVEERWKAVAA